jgi:hypothetical protein|tara:strand:+ start:411 stop:527 length:117 start_codon:yes stop_codon:yes gene_type:complete
MDATSKKVVTPITEIIQSLNKEIDSVFFSPPYFLEVRK